MEKIFVLICFKVLFIKNCSAEKDPDTQACIDNYELSFFCDPKFFNDAKNICEDKGSFLVKIDNANMMEVINSAIDRINCSGENIHFHAGATADRNRKWTWLDGSKVHLRDEEGYQNWRENQPNNFGGREDCLRIDKYTKLWYDSPCNGGEYEIRNYICQKNLTLNIKITELSFDALECSVTSKTCVNQVKWLQNHESVSTFQNHSVYQDLSSGTSILHYENATIKDGGDYSCLAWILNNEANRVTASEHIKVNGTPKLTDIYSFTCNNSLMIFWNPHLRSIRFLHRIKVINSYSGVLVREIVSTPVRNTKQITEIVGLQPATNYNLQISACNDEKICTYEHTVNATATTGGVVMKNATMLSVNDTCIVTWNWPYNISAVFHVKIFVYFSSGYNVSEVEVLKKTENKLSHSFEMQPEQIYEIQIHANDSAKVCSERVNVVGSCQERNTATTTSDQVTRENEETNTANIIVPVVSAIAVIILLTVAFVAYKMKTRTEQSGKQNTKLSTNNTKDATEYGTVGDGEIIAAYSTIDDQPAVYVNYQQNSSYETVETNQHDIKDVYET